ncbi:MAG: US12 family protein [Firmicutes bacterium]|nr:US12 family protein [Bacillota bacterium]
MELLNNTKYKAQRLEPLVSGERLLSRRVYNLLMGGTLVWGFLVDVIVCMFTYDIYSRINPIALIVLYLAVSIISIIVIHRSDSAVISFAAFTALAAVMGILLSGIISSYTADSVFDAFIHTGIVCLIVGLLATSFPQFFLKLGRGLFIVFLAVFAVEIVLLLIFHSLPQITSIAMVLVFGGYFGYDLVKAQQYVPTADNAVDSAADIYIDVINLFIRLLVIFGSRD